MKIILNPGFWFALLLVAGGAIAVLAKVKKDLLNNTAIAVGLSILFALAYFHLVDHYLMDMQGLDYWYLFRG
jgi:hypothetical protein